MFGEQIEVADEKPARYNVYKICIIVDDAKII
jgi:hypothetical protein